MDRYPALYARVSTDEQSREGYSIPTQIEKGMAYCKIQGWPEPKIFPEDGKSAKDMNRPYLKQLIKEIKQGKISAVITTAVDRLSRNLRDMLEFIDLCEKHNTAYVCLALNFDTSTPIGRMVLQILAAFAEFERAMTSTRVKSTMAEIADKKMKYMAAPPFGYKLDEHGNLVVTPEEAGWIVKAADMFIAGHGYRSVCQFLNANGIKTSKGKEWSASTLRGVLTNELYIGKFVWNRRKYDKAGKMLWRDPSEWIVHENTHPSILSNEQWTEIQKRITRRVPKGGQVQSKYRMSGMMKCAYCGGGMVSRRYGSKGTHKDRYIFVCSNYQKSGSCKFNYAFMDDVEKAVYETLERLSEGLIQIPTSDLSKASEAQNDDFKRRESAIDQKFQRQIQAYENGLISDRDLKIARERIEKERELLQQQKERAKTPQPTEIENLIQKEAKQLLWLWKNGELPVLQNSLRILFESFMVLDGKVIDGTFSEEVYSAE